MYNECIEEISKVQRKKSKKCPLENIHHDAQEDHAMEEEGSEVEDA